VRPRGGWARLGIQFVGVLVPTVIIYVCAKIVWHYFGFSAAILGVLSVTMSMVVGMLALEVALLRSKIRLEHVIIDRLKSSDQAGETGPGEVVPEEVDGA
jgi:hypothetical protein